MNLFYQPRLSESVTFLDGDEAHHAIKSLRLRSGDEILVTDGKGIMAKAVISHENNFIVREQSIHKRNYETHLFVAPTKNSDRIEWLVEKATEIGVNSITLFECERSERRKINHERLVKMAVSAMKQSQQSWVPEIKGMISFEEIIQLKYDQNFIAFVDHSNPDHLKNLAHPGKSHGILIGPEGDFTQQEVDLAIANGWTKASLGTTRLRTETAALTAVVLLNNLA